MQRGAERHRISVMWRRGEGGKAAQQQHGGVQRRTGAHTSHTSWDVPVMHLMLSGAPGSESRRQGYGKGLRDRYRHSHLCPSVATSRSCHQLSLERQLSLNFPPAELLDLCSVSGAELEEENGLRRVRDFHLLLLVASDPIGLPQCLA